MRLLLRMPAAPAPAAAIAPMLVLVATALLAGCATTHSVAELEITVRDTETAFAATLARRDFAAFQQFIASDAVFLSGPQTLRGRAAVAAAWRAYFDAPAPPFSWRPDTVQVLATGRLATTGGPVTGPAGEPFGRFSSVWRRGADGHWQIVFDKGEAPCPCQPPQR